MKMCFARKTDCAILTGHRKCLIHYCRPAVRNARVGPRCEDPDICRTWSSQMKPLHSLRAMRLALPLFSCIAWSQVPGPNINIVSNDPYNQKQVEVDAAANPLNPNHIVAGFIDYQVVVNENPALEPESSAWCGFSFSVNGRIWKSTLVPGFPADTSTAGKSST